MVRLESRENERNEVGETEGMVKRLNGSCTDGVPET